MQILHVSVYKLPWSTSLQVSHNLDSINVRFCSSSIFLTSRTSSSYDSYNFCSLIDRSIVKLSAFILSIELVKLFESVGSRKHRCIPSQGKNQRVKSKA